MDDLRSLAPLLAVLAAGLVVVLLFMKRMADFGKDINDAAHDNRRPTGGRSKSGGRSR